MSPRLLRIIIPAEDEGEVRRILEEHGIEAPWTTAGGPGAVAVEVAISSEGNEPLLDDLQDAFEGTEGFRLLLLPLAATVPRIEEIEDEEEEGGDDDARPGPDEASGEPEAAGASHEARTSGERVPVRAPAGPRGPVGGEQGVIPPRAEARIAGPPEETKWGEEEQEKPAREPEEGGREEEPEGESGAGEGEEEEEEGPARISREELHVRITDLGGLSWNHLAMVALSAVIACVGLMRDSSPVVVGAMVIAPVIGPNMALSLATTLGDLEMGKNAVLTGIAGMITAIAVAVAWGSLSDVDPTGAELVRVSRTGYPELALALAAGSAGVLSISRGTDTALVGVMVAVAVLPPTVAGGLFLGGGQVERAVQAFAVVASNVICINLAGVVTFLVQGVHPRSWWEADRARRATQIALLLWVFLLAGMVAVIGRLWGR